MAAIVAAYGRLRDRLRDYQLLAGQFLTGPGLFILFFGLGLWALISRTDAFVIGVVTGSVLALGAMGLTLIYGVLKFAHFAHGDSMMLAAYIAFFALTGVMVGERTDTKVLPWSLSDLPGATRPILNFSFGYGLLIAMAIASVLMVAVFLVLDRLIYRPLRRRGSGIVIFAIASLGVAIAMRSLILILWASFPRFYVPGIRPTTDLPFGIRIVSDQIFIFCGGTGPGRPCLPAPLPHQAGQSHAGHGRQPGAGPGLRHQHRPGDHLDLGYRWRLGRGLQGSC